MKPAPHPATTRVFFALWPTAAERAQLAAWRTPLKQLCGGRTMRADTLHATLVFIGNVGPGRLKKLQQAAREVCTNGFELCLDEARYWAHNHIMYAAPGHTPHPLTQLVDTLSQQLDAHFVQFDRHGYQPHVTLLRNARWGDAPLPTMQPVCWQVKDFALVQSAQQDGLADYRVLARFPLRAGDS